MDVYIETGKKKSFASARDWPGWSRSGRDEAAALQALLAYAPRYARALRGTRLPFDPPAELSGFTVTERLEGNSTTDFGAPGVAASDEAEAISDAELHRLQTILEACWREFDEIVEAAAGRELRKGPRGGGRDIEGIVRHVMGAEAGYLGSLGWKHKVDDSGDLREEQQRARHAVLEALAAAARGELPTRGPRGGARWSPRYFARRVAWHVLDHAWEIEDRAT